MFRQEQAALFDAEAALVRLLRAALALLLAVAAVPAVPAAAPAPVLLLTIDGAIGPASADYVTRGIARAVREGDQLVVLQIDTPGGLDTSMRAIVKAILASPVPVATFVAPGGARAASAGTYILYASHIAAMAPGTNLGAATPVELGAPGLPERERPAARKDNEAGKDGKDDGKEAAAPAVSPMAKKQVNDAAAYIRGLAQMRGRNGDWAERAVREAVSLPASEAQRLRVIDLIAADVPALDAQLDGRKVNVLGQERLLRTRGATVVDARPDWRAQLLSVITNPSIALLLMTLGIYGLLFEFMHPGLAVPGVAGAIFLVLALYALHLLPVNYAGLMLIVLGLAFMAAEAFLPSFGVIGVGGIAAFVAGALILIDTEQPGYGIPLPLIVTLAAASALLLAGLATVALKTRRRHVVTGAEGLMGSVGEVLTTAPDGAWARVHGETWRVTSGAPLRPAQQVRVVGRRGLVLEVVLAGNHEKGE